MVNQSNQEHDSEHTTFYDQADQTFNQKISDKEIKLSKGIKADALTEDEADELLTAEEQVRATEDASLQDDSYSFDEDNTDNEEYHDASDAVEYDVDSDDLH